MDQEGMRLRTKEFGKGIIRLCRQLPENREGRLMGNQLFRCGTSVGANYRAACRGRSKADFRAKLAICLEEADESIYWMEMLEECGTVRPDVVADAVKEARELVAIFVASLNTLSKQLV